MWEREPAGGLLWIWLDVLFSLSQSLWLLAGRNTSDREEEAGFTHLCVHRASRRWASEPETASCKLLSLSLSLSLSPIAIFLSTPGSSQPSSSRLLVQLPPRSPLSIFFLLGCGFQSYTVRDRSLVVARYRAAPLLPLASLGASSPVYLYTRFVSASPHRLLLLASLKSALLRSLQPKATAQTMMRMLRKMRGTRHTNPVSICLLALERAYS